MVENKITVYSTARWLKITLNITQKLLVIAGILLFLAIIGAVEGELLHCVKLIGVLGIIVASWHIADALKNYKYRETITTIRVMTDYNRYRRVSTRRTERIHRNEPPYLRRITRTCMAAQSQDVFTDIFYSC
ncbi:hypothetical protein FACS1894188_07660 [Clostridia bacterium]|nr:hypothetical protein FACS1894188_07660 [Clostridia bacterium]